MRPSRDEVLMRTAALWALRSTCSRAQVGCVISRDGRILVTGYNGAPAGLPHCVHPDEEAGAGVLGSIVEIKEGCRASAHAEENAIAYAARYGMRLEGAILHTTLTPCRACARLIINTGIVKVFAGESYRDPAGVDLLWAAGIDTELLTV